MSSKNLNTEKLDLPCDCLYEDDLIDPRRFFRGEMKVERHRPRRFCDQVARSLRHALQWEAGDPLLSAVEVTAVEPPEGGGSLRVGVRVDGASPEEILARLNALRGFLRSAIARDVHRRRVPELNFQWRLAGSVDDER